MSPIKIFIVHLSTEEIPTVILEIIISIEGTTTFAKELTMSLFNLSTKLTNSSLFLTISFK